MNYSTSQMDDFYSALASGIVKPSGIMNYIQHLFIAERTAKQSGQSVLDVCCGRGLLVPLLTRYSPAISEYLGIDISSENLDEARSFIARIGIPPFPYSFIRADVTLLTQRLTRTFDVIAYTSAIEHLPKKEGLQSLHEVSALLASDGILYLSTPRTPKLASPNPQYSVHIYEWDRAELEEALAHCGLKVLECIGLLPPDDTNILEAALDIEFGSGAILWYRAMRAAVPAAFLAPVLASAVPQVAKELMFVCTHKG